MCCDVNLCVFGLHEEVNKYASELCERMLLLESLRGPADPSIHIFFKKIRALAGKNNDTNDCKLELLCLLQLLPA